MPQRWTTFFAAAVLVASLACGGSTEPDTSDTSTDITEETDSSDRTDDTGAETSQPPQDDSIKVERVTESEPVELSLRDRITQAVERTPDLIARCRAMNPGVRLDTLEATQRGTDLVIHGAGRNVGDCALGGFKVRASAWGEIDGVGVRVDGQSTNTGIVELEEAFTFELYFYGTAKRGAPITVWFVLDDSADFVQENDPLVHSAVGLNLLAPRIVLQ